MAQILDKLFYLVENGNSLRVKQIALKRLAEHIYKYPNQLKTLLKYLSKIIVSNDNQTRIFSSEILENILKSLDLDHNKLLINTSENIKNCSLTFLDLTPNVQFYDNEESFLNSIDKFLSFFTSQSFLYNQSWNFRHSALLIIKTLLKTLLLKNDKNLDTNNLISLYKTHFALLMIDQFCDYLGEDIVAPIRELCAQNISLIYDISVKNNVCKMEFQLNLRSLIMGDIINNYITTKIWHQKFGMLLIIKYLLPNFKKEDLAFDNSNLLISILIKSLADKNEDIASLSSYLLNFIISILNTQQVDDILKITFGKIENLDLQDFHLSQTQIKNLFNLILTISQSHDSQLVQHLYTFGQNVCDNKHLNRLDKLIEIIYRCLFCNSTSQHDLQMSALNLFYILKKTEIAKQTPGPKCWIFQDSLLIFTKILLTGNDSELTSSLLKIWETLICPSFICPYKSDDYVNFCNAALRLISLCLTFNSLPPNFNMLPLLSDLVVNNPFGPCYGFQSFISSVIINEASLAAQSFMIGVGAIENIMDIRFLASKCLAQRTTKILDSLKYSNEGAGMVDITKTITPVLELFDQNFKINLSHNSSNLQKSMQLTFIYHFILATMSNTNTGMNESIPIRSLIFNFLSDSSYLNIFLTLATENIYNYDEFSSTYKDINIYSERFMENLNLLHGTASLWGNELSNTTFLPIIPETIYNSINILLNNGKKAIGQVNPDLIDWFALQQHPNILVSHKHMSYGSTTVSNDMPDKSGTSCKKRRNIAKRRESRLLMDEKSPIIDSTILKDGYRDNYEKCVDGAKILQSLNVHLKHSHQELNNRIKSLSSSILTLILFHAFKNNTVTDDMHSKFEKVNLVKPYMASIKYESSTNSFQSKVCADLLLLLCFGTHADAHLSKILPSDEMCEKVFDRLIFQYLPFSKDSSNVPKSGNHSYYNEDHQISSQFSEKFINNSTPITENISYIKDSDKVGANVNTTFLDYLMPLREEKYIYESYPTFVTSNFPDIPNCNIQFTAFAKDIATIYENILKYLPTSNLPSIYDPFPIKPLISNLMSTNNISELINSHPMPCPIRGTHKEIRKEDFELIPNEYLGARQFLQQLFQLLPLPLVQSTFPNFWTRFEPKTILERTLKYFKDNPTAAINLKNDDTKIELGSPTVPSEKIKTLIVELHLIEIILPAILCQPHGGNYFYMSDCIKLIVALIWECPSPVIRFCVCKILSSTLYHPDLSFDVAENILATFTRNALPVISTNHSCKSYELLGMLEGIIHLFSNLEGNMDTLLPYTVFYVVPCLGLLSHYNFHVRTAASRCFTTIFSYLSLNEIDSSKNPFSGKLDHQDDGVGNTNLLSRAYTEALTFLGYFLQANNNNNTRGSRGDVEDEKSKESSLFNCGKSFEEYMGKTFKKDLVIREYQMEGVKWLMFLKRYKLNGILCDDMGLGKTLQTICALAIEPPNLSTNHDDTETQNAETNAKISLVVCPHTLIYHWEDEINKFLLDPNEPVGDSPHKHHLFPITLTCLDDIDSRYNLSSILQKYKPGDHVVIITSYDVVRKHSLAINHFAASSLKAHSDSLKETTEPPKHASIASSDLKNQICETENYQATEEFQFYYCILDEGHIIKNPKSKVTQKVKEISATHRLILSGTPIQNNILELWSLFDFLMPDYLGSEKDFNSTFNKPIVAIKNAKNPNATEQENALKALDTIHKLILPFILRRTKDEVLKDLPPKIIQDLYCLMTPLQLEIYDLYFRACEDPDHTSLNEIVDETAHNPESKKNVLKYFHYSRMACNHPGLALRRMLVDPTFAASRDRIRKIFITSALDSRRRESKLGGKFQNDCDDDTDDNELVRCILKEWKLSGKMHSLIEILQECGIIKFCPENVFLNRVDDYRTFKSNDEYQGKALIFFQTVEALKMVQCYLQQFHVPTCTLLSSMSLKERHDIVKSFSTPTISHNIGDTNEPEEGIDINKEPKILLLTTKVGGLGLNLSCADTVIFYENDWNPVNDLQAMDRAHRIGQKKVVNVYRLITKGTLEEKIMNLQAFKLKIANSIINKENANLSTLEESSGNFLEQFSNTIHKGRSSRTKEGNAKNFKNPKRMSQFLDQITDENYDIDYKLDGFDIENLF